MGDSAIYKTTDGGEFWQAKDSTIVPGGMFLEVKDKDTLFYSSAKFGLNTSSPGIRKTTDGGNIWITVDSSLSYYTDLKFVSKQVGFATGLNKNGSPAMVKTKDGGGSWEIVANDFSPSNYDLESLTFPDELHGWALSYDGYVFNTINGGNVWTLLDSIRPAPPKLWISVRDIEFTSPDSGWVVGGLSTYAITARTTDGGKNWTVFEWRGCSTREIVFLDHQTGWLVGWGYSPFIFNSTDGGINWLPQTLNYSDPGDRGFESISMIHENLGWAVGTRPGKICKLFYSEVSSIQNINTQIINSYVLEQNFPNPFNPATTIGFQTPKTDIVTIKLFDLLGKEITIIYQKNTPAGKHKIHFDASGYANGIYFYSMQVGNFIEYRKLLFLK